MSRFSLSSLFLLSLLVLTSYFLLPTSVHAATIKLGASTQGLIGYWTFDEGAGTTAVDHSGNRNNGTLSSIGVCAVPSWTSGRLGNALNFNCGLQSTNGSYVSIPSTVSLQPTAGLTISEWINPSAAPAVSGTLFDHQSGSPYYGYSLALTTGQKIDLEVAYNVNAGDAVSSAVIPLNRWSHVVATWNGSTWVIYINGAQDNTGTLAGPVTYTVSPDPAIAARANVPGGVAGKTNIFKGNIDDVRLYNRALSASEVFALYVAGEAKVNSSNLMLSSGSSLSTGLVGYWPLDNSTINWATGQVSDKSGSGKTGTVVNMSTTSSPTIGKIGQALSFGGIDTQCVSIPTGNLVSTGKGTMSSWVYINGTQPETRPRFVTFGGGDFWIGLSPSNTGSIVALAFDSNNRIADSGINYTTYVNQWILVTATSDGTTLRLYINGVQKATAPEAGPLTADTNVFIASHNCSLTSFAFKGKVDDVRIYNRVLSASEVQQLYKLGNTAVNTSAQNRSTNTSLTSGLVGYWTFDGAQTQTTIADSSGQGNNGYIGAGGPATSTMKVIGKIGQALKFDGTSSYIAGPASPSFVTNTQGTIAGWMYFKGFSSSGDKYEALFEMKGVGNGSDWLFFGVDSGDFASKYFQVQFRPVTNDAIYAGNFPIVANTWYHVALTSDGSSYKIYINGVNQALTVGNGLNRGKWFGNLPADTYTPLIGKHTSSGLVNNFSNAIMDDVRIYNRALSASEVLQLYTLGK